MGVGEGEGEREGGGKGERERDTLSSLSRQDKVSGTKDRFDLF